MASRILRHAAVASAAMLTAALTAVSPAVAVPASSRPAGAVDMVPAGSEEVVTAASVRHITSRSAEPSVTPRRTVLRYGEPIVFAGHAAPGSTVRLAAVLDAGWEFLTPALSVPRSGRVRVSAPLPAGIHLVRADVYSRSFRYGFGPYVATVAARGKRPPTYTTYSLTQLLVGGKVTMTERVLDPNPNRMTITAGGRRFVAQVAFAPDRAKPTNPALTPIVTVGPRGCIEASLEVAVPDGAPADQLVSVSLGNRWSGRTAGTTVSPGHPGRIFTLLDGGTFTINASGAGPVYLRGTVTCPR